MSEYTPAIIVTSGELGLSTLIQLKGISIVYIFTDKGSTGIIDYAKVNSIPCFVGNPKKINDYSFLKEYSAEILISINYLFIISRQFIDIVHGNAINIHGALLPKYRGRTPHVWAIINGEQEAGITIHYIVEEVDAGDILLQERIEIDDSDTGGNLLNKFKLLYPYLLNKAIGAIQNQTIHLIKQDEYLATYFPKRTSEDGLIDWNWQSKRLINWIRALTKPYPGAYTFINDSKLIVWKAKISNQGFNGEWINGIVIKGNKDMFSVKCANAVIDIEEYDCITSPTIGIVLNSLFLNKTIT